MLSIARSVLFALGLVALAAGASLVPPAAAQNVEALGTHRDWHTFQFAEGGNRVCYMASKPSREEPATVNHGDIFLLITHRPAEGSRDVISLLTGYNFRADSDVRVTIGGDNFTLFTHENTAWARDADTDRRLVQAMRAGSDMTVRGISARGTNVTYTFSLLGATAAHNQITQACGL